jgi:DHA3 family tetracycline resistance protein-like MFS transporter
MPNRLPAYTVYLLMRFGFAFAFALFATTSGIYRVQDAGLNPFQLVLIGTALELAAFLFEMPTGIVADVYSRRLSIVIGYVIIGAGFILEGSSTIFVLMLLAQVVWGIGWTFTSGATDAWLADEVGEAGLVRVLLRGSQAATVGSIVGILGGIALGTVEIRLAMIVGGALFIALGVFLMLAMPERNYTPISRAERGTLGTMTHTFRAGIAVVRGRPLLVTLLIVGALYGASSEAFDRLREAHLLREFDFPVFDDQPVVWIGALALVGMFFSLVVSEVIRRRINAESQTQAARALLVINSLLMLAVIGFGLAVSIEVAIGAYLVAYLMRQINEPLYAALVNRSLDPQVRATVLSMTSQSDALGQFTGGPLLGALGALAGVRTTIVATALILLPALGLYARITRQPTTETPPLPDLGEGAGE